MAQITGSDVRFTIEQPGGTTWTGLAGLVSISEQEVYEGVREWAIDMRGMGALTETVTDEPWGNGSTANYPAVDVTGGNSSSDWAYVTLEETTPLACPYCGGTFGADDVRCRGCGADVMDAVQ